MLLDVIQRTFIYEIIVEQPEENVDELRLATINFGISIICV